MAELRINTSLIRRDEIDRRTVYVFASPWSLEEITALMNQVAPEDLKVQAALDGHYREFIVLSQTDGEIWLIIA